MLPPKCSCSHLPKGNHHADLYTINMVHLSQHCENKVIPHILFIPSFFHSTFVFHSFHGSKVRRLIVVIVRIIVASTTSRNASIVTKSIVAIPWPLCSLLLQLPPKPFWPLKFPPWPKPSFPPKPPPPALPEPRHPVGLEEAPAISCSDRAFLPAQSCLSQSCLQSHGHQRLQSQSLSSCRCLSQAWFQSFQFPILFKIIY